MQHCHRVSGAKIAVLGLTFKEKCPDLGNSKVVNIIDELPEYCCELIAHDPLAKAAEALSEYGVALCEREDLRGCQAVILAVPHAQYLHMSVAEYGEMMDQGATLIDLKSVLDREELEAAKLKVWRL